MKNIFFTLFFLFLSSCNPQSFNQRLNAAAMKWQRISKSSKSRKEKNKAKKAIITDVARYYQGKHSKLLFSCLYGTKKENKYKSIVSGRLLCSLKEGDQILINEYKRSKNKKSLLIFLMSELVSEKIKKVLISELNNDEYNVRLSCVSGLGKESYRGDKEILKALDNLLVKERHGGIAESMVWAYYTLLGKKSVSRLKKIFENGKEGKYIKNSKDAQKTAARCLEEFGEKVVW